MAVPVFPDKAKVLKLAEVIQARLAHAQQLKMSGTQAINMQSHVAQAEEMQRRLTEAVLRLQDAARDYTLPGVRQRLETISKKLNLLFDIQQTPQGTVCFLSCTDFYLEVGFHENGLVSSAKVVHTHLGSREPLILDSVLTDHTFSTLESHLSGLLQVYSQAEGQQEGGQLFQALSATESVLRSIYQHGQSASPQEAIMSHPMGLLTPRDGGLPMKLTYFQHPYDAMTKPLSDHVTSHDHEVGVTASVLVEKSTHHCLLSLDPNLFRCTPPHTQ
jgi:hypothetical protein